MELEIFLPTVDDTTKIAANIDEKVILKPSGKSFIKILFVLLISLFIVLYLIVSCKIGKVMANALIQVHHKFFMMYLN